MIKALLRELRFKFPDSKKTQFEVRKMTSNCRDGFFVFWFFFYLSVNPIFERHLDTNGHIPGYLRCK